MKAKRTSERGRDGTRGGWPAEGATARPLGLAAPRARRAPAAGGFTLTELLIVIGLIVLLIAITVPAFRAMTGGRSVDSAANQLAAVLGQARNEAIGLQEKRGVFFYVDVASTRIACALVREAGQPFVVPPPVANGAEVYLDLVPDRDPVLLPVGVGLQVVDNAEVNDNGTPANPADDTRRDDGYLGYNTTADAAGVPNPGGPQFGGVILFDEYGRLINKRYGFLVGRPPAGSITGTPQPEPTAIGQLLFNIPPAPNGTIPQNRFAVIPRQVMPTSVAENNWPPRTQLGFVLFDQESFTNQGFTAGDPQLNARDAGRYAAGSKEMTEEQWLDQNGSPALVNRYNGTLMRAE